MPSNKLVLHPVDEVVISFPWRGGGDEILQVNALRKSPQTGECQSVLCKFEGVKIVTSIHIWGQARAQ